MAEPKIEWVPEMYFGECSPIPRPHPDDWVTEDGHLARNPLDEDDEDTETPLHVGRDVWFRGVISYGWRPVTVTRDDMEMGGGGWPVAPDGFDVMAHDGDAETLSRSLPELVASCPLLSEGETVTVFVYAWAWGPVRWRYSGSSFERVEDQGNG
jgi:hypothetical protein